MKRYRKTRGAKQLLAACRVGGVVTTQETIVSAEVELMRKRILWDHQRDPFSGEVHLRPGLEHPKVRGTERLGFAKLDLYPNDKPKSVKPIRLVGERAAVDQEMVEHFWLVVGSSPVLPPRVRPTVSLCPTKRKVNGAPWRTANLMRVPCPTGPPSPSLKICWKVNPNRKFSVLWYSVKGSIKFPFTLSPGLRPP